MFLNRESSKIAVKGSTLNTRTIRVSRISVPKIISILIIIYLYGFLIFYFCVSNLWGPTGRHLPSQGIVIIRSGMSAMEIGSLLENKGFIKNATLFRLSSVLFGDSRSLKAGAYSLDSSMSMFQILRKIVGGDVTQHKFTIPEGFTLQQVASLWESKKLGKGEDFIQVSLDPVFREKYGIKSDTLEGYLFPETYLFSYGISEREAIDKMLGLFNIRASYLMAGKHTEVQLSDNELMTLASIIEREAKVGYEKPIISSVFYNRLKRGKRLESCATVLYGLGCPNKELTYEDLRDTSSHYNTYVYKGLPPGPICNPGIESILAALNPSDDKYLYFVSKNDGTHYFAENYRDFLAAKRKYQKG